MIKRRTDEKITEAAAKMRCGPTPTKSSLFLQSCDSGIELISFLVIVRQIQQHYQQQP
ncbi:MAG: hypothetical protein ACJ71R_22210 [Nitrososphaeraceae archaeon]